MSVNRVFKPKFKHKFHCPTCHTTFVAIEKHWSPCPVCERKYRMVPCDRKNPTCARPPATHRFHLEVHPSRFEREYVRMIHRKQTDLREHPEDYVPCWRCDDGVCIEQIEFPGGFMLRRIPCFECDGLGSRLRV